MAMVETERVEDEIVIVRLNRPERLNAMTLRLLGELGEVLASLDGDETCRVVILTGAGRGFCSGADLSGEGEQPGSPAVATVQSGMRAQEGYAAIIPKLRNLHQPVIAAINGPAVGGGLGLALASDIRIASETARFAVAMVRIGLSGADVGISYLLPRAVGTTRAAEWMLTGRLVEADEALAAGLVGEVVPAEQVLPRAIELARLILGNSPFGVRLTKQAIWASHEIGSLQAAIELENRSQALALRTEDSVEAVTAYFVEKRPPSYRNR